MVAPFLAVRWTVTDDVDQVRLTWAKDGFGLMLSIEDPVDRWGSDSSFNTPDIIGAWKLKQVGWDAKFSAGFADLSDGTAWAVQAGATFDLKAIAEDDKFRFKVGAGGAPAGTGNAFLGCDGGGVCTYAMASLRHYWTSALSSAITYAFNDHGSDPDSYSVAGNLVWKGRDSTSVGFGARHTSEGGDREWRGKFKLKRELR